MVLSDTSIKRPVFATVISLMVLVLGLAAGSKLPIREYPAIEEPTFDQLVAELVECDWALVEGFKHAPLPKIEVWRAATGKPAQYPFDPFVIALATDDEAALPTPTGLPVFLLDDVDGVAAFILAQAERCRYLPRE